MNSKKETNGMVKMGQESKWAKDQDGLLTVNSKKETNGRVTMGQGSGWADVVWNYNHGKYQLIFKK